MLHENMVKEVVASFILGNAITKGMAAATKKALEKDDVVDRQLVAEAFELAFFVSVLEYSGSQVVRALSEARLLASESSRLWKFSNGKSTKSAVPMIKAPMWTLVFEEVQQDGRGFTYRPETCLEVRGRLFDGAVHHEHLNRTKEGRQRFYQIFDPVCKAFDESP